MPLQAVFCRSGDQRHFVEAARPAGTSRNVEAVPRTVAAVNRCTRSRDALARSPAGVRARGPPAAERCFTRLLATPNAPPPFPATREAAAAALGRPEVRKAEGAPFSSSAVATVFENVRS